jgi:pilus assembly protein CpaF
MTLWCGTSWGRSLAYYDDPSVSEIMINGPDEVFIDGRNGIEKTPHRMEDAAALRALARVILQYSGKRLTRDNLSLEARMPNRSRVHIVQDPGRASRHHHRDPPVRPPPPSLDDLVASGSLSARRSRLSARAGAGPPQHHHLGRHRARARPRFWAFSPA